MIENKFQGDTSTSGSIKSSTGATGTFIAGTKTVSVSDGIIISIVNVVSPLGRFGGYIDNLTFVAPPEVFAETYVYESAGLTVTRISVFAQNAGSGGSTGTVIRLSDGTTDLDVTLPPGQNFAEATFSQLYAQGSVLTLTVVSDDNGTAPTAINVMAQVSVSESSGRFGGYVYGPWNSGNVDVNFAQTTIDELHGIYVNRLSVAYISEDAGNANTVKLTDGTNFITIPGPDTGTYLVPAAFETPIGQDTSNTFNTIGTGTKNFTTPDNFTFTPGMIVKASAITNTTYGSPNIPGDANYMQGTVLSYSGGFLSVNVTLTGGSGSFNKWMIGETTYPGILFASASTVTMVLNEDTSFQANGIQANASYVPVNISDQYSRFGAHVETFSGTPLELIRTTIDETIVAKRISVICNNAGIGGSVGTTFRLTDGTNFIELTLPPGSTSATSAYNQTFTSGSTLSIFVQSDDNGTKPTYTQVIVENTLP